MTGRLVALDIDGTLTTSRQPVSPRVRAAVRAVVEGGDHVVLATGRPALAVRPVVEDLALSNGFAVCSNGAVLLDVSSRRALHIQPVSLGLILAAFDRQAPGALYAAEVVGVGNHVSGRFPDGALTGRQIPLPRKEIADCWAPRLAAWWPSRSLEDVRQRLSHIALPEVAMTPSTTTGRG
ncbi:HAD family hydrolase [Fodinicola feengrottensis]|uniref:HAD family hydrolase n=1 Tax=Fodinicola feengrottensis TaxID=435914 RepID=UPI0013D5D9C3|nr:HAD hydrolase family protein [Fodinicola feengrottensis]